MVASQNDIPALYYVATTKTGCRVALCLLGGAWTAHVDVVAAHLESLTEALEATAAAQYEQSGVGARTLLPKGQMPCYPGS